TVPLPSRSWIGVIYYGAYGAFLALLPWLAPRLRRIGAVSLQTQLAVAVAGAAAIPLVVVVALVTTQAQATATSQALALQEGLAVALAQVVGDYVNLHRAAVG